MKQPVSQQPVDQQPEGQLTSQTLVSTPGRGFTGTLKFWMKLWIDEDAFDGE